MTQVPPAVGPACKLMIDNADDEVRTEKQGTVMRVLEYEDIISLLRSEVEQAGGQVRWSKKTGINRVLLNLVLNGRKPVSKSILRALKLRTVVISERTL